MSENVIIALISGGTSLITALVTAVGAFQLSVKKDRDKQKQDLEATLDAYYNKNREAITEIRENDLREIRDDVTNMGANLQQKIALIEMSVGHTNENLMTLSNRVDKHNNVIERTFKCEQAILDIKDVLKELRDV